ncbi:uncharacterized protein LOC110462409 [Mizuhopecten yessoensis]|uniref:uncharacterized protein LOC110462409 n=1 Tax=Mizuhopecten yessoensis TaxID=6573 RepID=UPI000B458FA0|nr:uncharacterized protein LOC110462409 [Mizuhopecten yessoensis]
MAMQFCRYRPQPVQMTVAPNQFQPQFGQTSVVRSQWQQQSVNYEGYQQPSLNPYQIQGSFDNANPGRYVNHLNIIPTVATYQFQTLSENRSFSVIQSLNQPPDVFLQTAQNRQPFPN